MLRSVLHVVRQVLRLIAGIPFANQDRYDTDSHSRTYDTIVGGFIDYAFTMSIVNSNRDILRANTN